jgi:hypothetical protein
MKNIFVKIGIMQAKYIFTFSFFYLKEIYIIVIKY